MRLWQVWKEKIMGHYHNGNAAIYFSLACTIMNGNFSECFVSTKDNKHRRNNVLSDVEHKILAVV